MSTKKVFTILATQPDVTSAGTPERIIATDLWVEECLIEAPATNTGVIYINSSNATGTNRHTLQPGQFMTISTSSRAAATFNLKEIWFDGATSADKIVVSYLEA